MKENKTWNSEKKEWEEEKKEKSTLKYKSCTDISKWKPNVNMLNTIDACKSTEIDPSLYQFKDGVDTGERFYEFTDLGADVTERQEAYDRLKNKVEGEKNMLENAVKDEIETLKMNEKKEDNSNTSDNN